MRKLFGLNSFSHQKSASYKQGQFHTRTTRFVRQIPIQYAKALVCKQLKKGIFI